MDLRTARVSSPQDLISENDLLKDQEKEVVRERQAMWVFAGSMGEI